MFENQNKLKPEEIEAAAGKISGLDSSRFSKCLKDKKYLAQVESDINSGKDVGCKIYANVFC